MIKVNGSRIEFAGYEFGTRNSDNGETWRWNSYSEAVLHLHTQPGMELVMREIYTTGWTEAFMPGECF